jgi:hypothetical protein
VLWPYLLAGAISPVGNASGDVVTYILGFGPLGIGVVLYTLGIIVPGKAADKAAAAARETARADLVRENERLLEEKHRIEEERNAALNVAQEQLVPLLTSFVATSQSLIPLLQELVRRRER